MVAFKVGDQVTAKSNPKLVMIVREVRDGLVICAVPGKNRDEVFKPEELKNHGRLGPLRPLF